MTTQVIERPAVQFRTDDLSAAVRQAMDSAVAGLGASRAAVQQAIGQGDCAFCDRLRYRLSQGLGEYLGSTDPSVRAVYLYEPDYATSDEPALGERPGLSPGMSMLVWAERKSAALTAVLDSLATAVREEAAKWTCPKANALCWMLDAQVVDDGEVKARSGYGALVNSLYVRPIEVWHR
jgi:hypothetical protein